MLIAAIILLGIGNIAATLLLYALQLRAAKNFASRTWEQMGEELSKLVKNEPCQSASVLLAVGRVIGSEAGRSVKASLMADLSHAKRNANQDEADLAASALGEQNPGLGAVLAGMGPKSRKGMLSNPLLQLALQGFLGGGIPRGNHSDHSAPGSIPSVRERLKGAN